MNNSQSNPIYVPYSKGFHTLSDQRKLLSSRGMVITDDVLAEELLNRIGYYHLSAYWHSFRERSSNGEILDKFIDDTSFEDVFSLYCFDKKFRLILLDALERIEISLKSEFAHTLGAVDMYAHRDDDSYTSNFKDQNFDWIIGKLNKQEESSKEEFATHFRSKHTGYDMPIWMAIELYDFGMISHSISGLKKVHFDKMVSRYELERRNTLKSWMRVCNYLRNICSHHGRIWNRTVVYDPAIANETKAKNLIAHAEQLGDKKIYKSLLCVIYMMSVVCPRSSWSHRLKQFVLSKPKIFPLTDVAMGFPENWEEQDIWNL